MKPTYIRIAMLVVCLFVAQGAWAQQPGSVTQTTASAAPSIPAATVPQLIEFSGTLLDRNNRSIIGPVGVTFALYAEQTGGAALWMETQNVHPGTNGNYTTLLGAASKGGVPEELFANGEARWLGVQVERQPEQPRVFLVSVPYALKAGDATTLGGLPASAFALAGSKPSPSVQPSLVLPFAAGAQSPALPPAGTLDVTTAGGTLNKLAKFDTSTDITSSLIFDNGTNVSIGNTSPAAKLDVSGSGIFRGFLELPSTGTATATLGFNSQPFDLFASSFNSSTHAAVGQHFRWQAEPVGNNTASPLGKLNLLFASGTGTLTETGLSISNKGLITFASGQTLPTVTGNETITGTLTAKQLLSTVSTGTAPLTVTSTTQVPNLNASFLDGLSASAFQPAGAYATLGANTFAAGPQTVQTGAASIKGVIVKAAASQTANLQEWQTSTGNVQASITPAGAFVGPLGMLISHVSFGGIAGTSGTAGCNCGGSGTIFSAREGAIILKTGTTDSSTVFVGAGGSSLGINRAGTFLSARADWVSPGGIKAGHIFTVVAGNALGGRFGFKAVGTALNGITTSPFSGPETDVNLAITLTAFTSIDLLAIRRASSVEFYVNGVLTGSSTTNLPTGVDDMTGDLYELTVTNGASNSTDAELGVNMLTVGIPMF